MSRRDVVVCRPRSSSARAAKTVCSSCPTRRFTRVDLPTPELPTNAAVMPGPEAVQDRFESFVLKGRDGEHGRAPRSVSGQVQQGPQLGLKVGLVEEDDAVRAAAGDGHEVALDAPGVEVAVRRGDDEDHVHVGRDDLGAGGAACHLPAQGGAGFQQDVHASVCKSDPVTRRRHAVSGAAKAPGDAHRATSERACHQGAFAVLGHDPGRPDGRVMCSELVFKEVIPAEFTQRAARVLIDQREVLRRSPERDRTNTGQSLATVAGSGFQGCSGLRSGLSG